MTQTDKEDKDLEFLIGLDKKLHFITEVYFGKYGNGKVDDYTGESMKAGEIQKVFRILKKNDNLVIYPINTSFGFAVGFRVSEITNSCPGIPLEVNPVLTFKEDQLPKNYDFARLSEYFMKSKNIERAGLAGIKIENNHSRYDY